jgi:DNA-binding transcriptional regulator LsrR (DeoR family)
LTQQQIAKQLEMPQYKISWRLSRAKELKVYATKLFKHPLTDKQKLKLDKIREASPLLKIMHFIERGIP